MKLRLPRIMPVMALMLAALSAQALNLPVKKVKGQDVYYYKVENKESVYGIAKKLGISRQDIVRHNPSVADGVRKGMMLFFPVEEFSETTITATTPQTEPAEITEEPTVTAPELKPSIAVLLPFGLDSEEKTRRNTLALDFYKGFLLGIDTLASRPGKIEIFTFDTDCRNAESLLDKPEVASAAVILTPDNQEFLEATAARAAERGNYVLNVFLVPDTLYLSNAQVLQASIPQKQMYKLAADALIGDFEGYKPVILRNKNGKNEKEAFISYITERYASLGTEPVVIEYDNNLLMADLECLPVSGGERYVFIPSSGTLVEFNKFAYVLKPFRDRLKTESLEREMTETDSNRPQIAIFGYPDWTAFRGDALDALHKLEVTIYSRFFDNYSGFATESFDSSFKSHYGTEIIESVPSQALLGYDTACFIIKNLRANDGTFNPMYPSRFEGIQSTFDFEKCDNGYSNATLYIIKYLPGDTMSAYLR